MDKLQGWLERIQLPPRQYVANLDYWELLAETRVDPGALMMGRSRPGESPSARPCRYAAPAAARGQADAGM